MHCCERAMIDSPDDLFSIDDKILLEGGTRIAPVHRDGGVGCV